MRPVVKLNRSPLIPPLPGLTPLRPCIRTGTLTAIPPPLSHGIPSVRLFHTQGEEPAAPASNSPTEKTALRRLPLQCTGCGAFTQTADSTQAGYFNLERRAVREYLGLVEPRKKRARAQADVAAAEDQVVEATLANLDPAQLEALGLSREDLIPERADPELETESRFIFMRRQRRAHSTSTVCEKQKKY